MKKYKLFTSTFPWRLTILAFALLELPRRGDCACFLPLTWATKGLSSCRRPFHLRIGFSLRLRGIFYENKLIHISNELMVAQSEYVYKKILQAVEYSTTFPIKFVIMKGYSLSRDPVSLDIS